MAPPLLTTLFLQCFLLLTGVIILCGKTLRFREAFHFVLPFAISFSMLCVLNAYYRTMNYSQSFYALGFNIAELPIKYVNALILLIAILYGISFVFLWRRHRRALMRTAIKEGIDKLPLGILFATPGGIPVLCNDAMNCLCHELFGRSLQNAKLFWSILSEGSLADGTTRISGGSSPVLRLANGQVWSFFRQDDKQLQGKPIVEINALNITELYLLNDRLRADNEAIAMMSGRMRKYSCDAFELTRSRELLERKIHAHDELGRLLMETRRALMSADISDDNSALWKRWQLNAELMPGESLSQQKDDLYLLLQKTADSIGVRLNVTGSMPKHGEAAELIFAVGCEAITNLIRHAHGTELSVCIKENADSLTAVFSNNGERPQKEITEGGGLSALRRKVNNCGGEMSVKSLPEFSITLILPKKRGNLNEKSTYC